MKILVTGAAGFIGSQVSQRLLARGDEVVGLDNLNDYYDVSLKEARLKRLIDLPGFSFVRLDLGDRDAVARLFAEVGVDRVVHLAAQAGVRHSLKAPFDYVDSNLLAFMGILEGCRHHGVEHLTFASSSSVYGANLTFPFSVSDSVDHPLSLYAATKKANELMAHSYSSLYGLPTTGLRFFTVYGPWGRPDMAIFIFTRAILRGEPIDVFNFGEMERDFTYIDDIVEGVVRVSDSPAAADPAWDGRRPSPESSSAPYRIYNIGNNRPERLTRVIELLEQCLGREARKNLLPLQPGDVRATAADIDALEESIGFLPSTPIERGISEFVAWYRDYYDT